MTQRVSTLIVLLVLTACERTPGGSMSGWAVPAATTTRRAPARCDAAVSGETDAARATLRDQQKRAQSDADASAWVAVGQDLVRVARTQAEPRYYEQAADCAKQALARSSGDAAALRLLGLVLMNEHRFKEAR